MNSPTTITAAQLFLNSRRCQSYQLGDMAGQRGRLHSIEDWAATFVVEDAVAQRKMTNTVRIRRARLTRYVKGILAACVTLCVVAGALAAARSRRAEPWSELTMAIEVGTQTHVLRWRVHAAHHEPERSEIALLAHTFGHPSPTAKVSARR
jgi:hypothetical protein